jgi:hypothetical protein
VAAVNCGRFVLKNAFNARGAVIIPDVTQSASYGSSPLFSRKLFLSGINVTLYCHSGLLLLKEIQPFYHTEHRIILAISYHNS